MPPPPDPTPTTIPAIMALLQTILDKNWPGHVGGQLRVHQHGMGDVKLPIAPWRPPEQSQLRRPQPPIV